MNQENRKPFRLLFVCTGNICRSPTAHFVFRALVEREGLADQILVDSAGTHGYHVGSAADTRTIRHAARRGYDLGPHRARTVQRADSERFDAIVYMDEMNRQNLRQILTPAGLQKTHSFMAFHPAPPATEVPDPYSEGPEGFEHVLDLIEAAAPQLLEQIRSGTLLRS